MPKKKPVVDVQHEAYIVVEGLKLPQPTPKEHKIWKAVASELHPHVHELAKRFPGYSYRDRNASLHTDAELCQFLVKSLTKTKKLLFNISDYCYSLHTGKPLMRTLTVMRDETDIFSDEIKIRACSWNDIPKEFMKRVVKSDLALVEGVETLNKNVDTIYGTIRKKLNPPRTKKGKARRIPPGKEFWNDRAKELRTVRSQLRDLAVEFKEREVVCNITPLTLERSFKSMQQEIHGRV